MDITDFDLKVPGAFKGKEFSRISKSYLRAMPNHLGDRVAADYAERNGAPYRGDKLSRETEMHNHTVRGVVTRTAPGIIGDGIHGERFKFPEGTNVQKRVASQPKKMGKSGIVKGGI